MGAISKALGAGVGGALAGSAGSCRKALSSDMRLVREILQRLEENGRGSRTRSP